VVVMLWDIKSPLARFMSIESLSGLFLSNFLLDFLWRIVLYTR